MFKLKNFFTKKITPDSHFSLLDQNLLRTIITKNRNSLSEITNWLPENIKGDSYYNYGVPDEIYGLLNLEVGKNIIYTDLICYYGSCLKNINYLELGVSVGKNFWQLINYFDNAKLTGFDIENFNPVIKSKLHEITTTDWKTNLKSLRLENPTLSEFKHNSNKVDYLAGDIWDETNWKKLSGRKFNIIFSDALHDPKALLWEFEMILKYNLLAEEFLFFWDDLNNGLDDSFLEIALQLKKTYKLNTNQIKLIKINGWLGENYPIKHDVGIISTLNLQ